MKWQKMSCVMVAVVGMSVVQAAELPSAGYQQLPKWRGFNLLEKFMWNGKQRRFLEKDFALISQLGFNFVRLPMDYRHWIVDGDWEKIDESVLEHIDEAIAFGRKYGVHVSINFHRAPGYTVAKPKEAKDLWTDADAQRVCAMHWATFARRYRDVPNANLSFNLFNEPSAISGETYAAVVKIITDAIRAESPERLIICDGLQWGNKPCLELVPLQVAQATRGYWPMNISHYQATWAGGERYALPTWPQPVIVGWLAGPAKKDLSVPLLINWDAGAASKLRLHIGTVSQRIHLQLKADGAPIWDRKFVCGPGEGEWKKARFSEEWNIYQNEYDMDCLVDIPAGVRELSLEAIDGDWVMIKELGVTRGDQPEARVNLLTTYGAKALPIRFADNAWQSENQYDRQYHWNNNVMPWQQLREQGVGVMVGEFGAFNKTPHDVVLRWLEDCLANWQQAGWGWAMWNFRGPFGILDSGRADVDYEDFHGHKLDRKMLDLLLKYK
ncbi:MAG: glycoside hydrolase family 5 protein [Lentisphaeria bacterium]|jgi:aryl-phospho-beta-D-glucosidase BglC (GH1 family)